MDLVDELEKPSGSRLKLGCLLTLGLSAVGMISLLSYEYMRRQSQIELLREEKISPVRQSMSDLFFQYLDGERRVKVHSGHANSQQFFEVTGKNGKKVVVSDVIGEDLFEHQSTETSDEGTRVLRQRLIFEKNINTHRFTSFHTFKPSVTRECSYTYAMDGDVDIQNHTISLFALSFQGTEPFGLISTTVSLSSGYDYDFPQDIVAKYLTDSLLGKFERKVVLNGIKYQIDIPHKLRMKFLAVVLNAHGTAAGDRVFHDLVAKHIIRFGDKNR